MTTESTEPKAAYESPELRPAGSFREKTDGLNNFGFDGIVLNRDW
ncbi:lasso RiPP family leader peptide-containing protein [Amycolatopsis halotolerans]